MSSTPIYMTVHPDCSVVYLSPSPKRWVEPEKAEVPVYWPITAVHLAPGETKRVTLEDGTVYHVHREEYPGAGD